MSKQHPAMTAALEFIKLRRERDELLAALEAIVYFATGPCGKSFPDDLREQARALIAKIKEEA